MPMAIMALRSPGPKTVMTMMARRMVGNETRMSTRRMVNRSSQPPGEARGEADGHATHEGQPHRHGADHERDARAEHHLREHVAPQAVRAEGMRPRGRPQVLTEAHGVGIVRGEPRREESHDGEHEHDGCAHQGAAMPEQRAHSARTRGSTSPYAMSTRRLTTKKHAAKTRMMAWITG